MIKIKVVKIPENLDEEVLFHVHEIAGNVQQAISILKSSNQHFFCKRYGFRSRAAVGLCKDCFC